MDHFLCLVGFGLRWDHPPLLLSEDSAASHLCPGCCAVVRCRWTCGPVRGSRVFTQVCHMCQMQRTAERKASRVSLTIWARHSYMRSGFIAASPLFEDFLTRTSAGAFDEGLRQIFLPTCELRLGCVSLCSHTVLWRTISIFVANSNQPCCKCISVP